MRALLALCLSLLMAVTSVTFAVARGQEAGLTETVICSQGAAMTVYLDASGTPTAAPHHCPDCLSALPAPPVPVAVRLPGVALRSVKTADIPVALAPALPTCVPPARGPPVPV